MIWGGGGGGWIRILEGGGFDGWWVGVVMECDGFGAKDGRVVAAVQGCARSYLVAPKRHAGKKG
jgi:hypothetical protein